MRMSGDQASYIDMEVTGTWTQLEAGSVSGARISRSLANFIGRAAAAWTNDRLE